MKNTPKCCGCCYCNLSSHGYLYCDHQKIDESAKRYEKKTGKSIRKASFVIGYKMPKTSLRWCPLKEE